MQVASREVIAVLLFAEKNALAKNTPVQSKLRITTLSYNVCMMHGNRISIILVGFQQLHNSVKGAYHIVTIHPREGKASMSGKKSQFNDFSSVGLFCISILWNYNLAKITLEVK